MMGPPFAASGAPGTFSRRSLRAPYVARILSFVDIDRLPAVHIVTNAGNGAAGPTFDAICAALE